MDSFFILYLIMAAAVIIPLAAWYLLRLAQVRAWGHLAQQTGLQFEGGAAPWKTIAVSGTYRSRRLVMNIVQHGTQKSRQSFTRVVVTARSGLIPQLELKPEGLFDFFGKMVGWQDIEIGDEKIDKKFTITGQPVAEVVKVLSSLELRQRLLEMPSVRLAITGSDVACEKRGIEKGSDKLLQLMDLATTLAEQAERFGGPAGQN